MKGAGTIIRTCPSCKKRFVEDKGFYKNASTASGYSSACKTCDGELSKDFNVRSRGGRYELHAWGEWDESNRTECTRCGLKVKRVANQHKPGRWVMRFLVDGKWSKERPEECKVVEIKV